MGHYLIKTKWLCLGSLELNLGLLNDCIACYTQENQVSTQLGDQSRSGILKHKIDKLLKPDERLYFHILAAKEKLATMGAEQLNKYNLKKIIK